MPKGDNQPMARCPDTEFVELFEKYGPRETGRRLNTVLRAVYNRRGRLETKLKRQITAPAENKGNNTRHEIEHPGRLHVDIENGVGIVFSDAHFWPGVVTTAHRAVVKFCDELNPDFVDCNGDAFDGASISRHSPIGWENRPSVIQELETCQERLGEIEDKLRKKKRVRRLWGLGNHCARFETRLATVAPEYAKVKGVHLKDHFPLWEPCWSVWVNNETVIKHRYKGGIHATHNNAVQSGKNMVTGHLHNPQVVAWSDYSGTRYGMDTGTTAEPYGPQFEYLEDSPRNWRSAFGVLTFFRGKLLRPEIVQVFDEDHVEFRGQVIKV